MNENSQTAVEDDRSKLHEILAPALKWAPLLCVALALLYRPVCSSLTPEVPGLSLFILLLTAAATFWFCKGAIDGALEWKWGTGSWAITVFLLWAAFCGLNGHHAFASIRVWSLYLSYGLTGFLILQLVDDLEQWDFLLSCLLATGVMLAGYGLFHRIFYIPALQTWLHKDPTYFRTVFEASGGLFNDLVTRVEGGRAYGNFITPNQLANYLLLVLFPIAGLAAGVWKRAAASDEADRGELWLITGISVFVVAVLVLTGSKGGLVGFVIGAAVFGVIGWWKHMDRGAWIFVAGAAAFVCMFLAAQWLGLAPGWERFAASLEVRMGYWEVTSEIIGDHPTVGVGPGCWAEHYTQRKAPQHGETHLAHNLYLQIWSETGTIGFGIFLLVLISPVWTVWRNGFDGPVNTAPGTNTSRDFLCKLGVALAIFALTMDYLFVGSFRPPAHGTPQLIEAIPWLPYILLLAIWITAYYLLMNVLGRRRSQWYLYTGLCAGLIAFLVHSSAEFTLRIPAIGTTAMGLATLLVTRVSLGEERKVQKLKIPLVAILAIVAFVVTFVWGNIVVPRTLDYGLKMDQIFQLRGEAKGGKASEKRQKIIKHYREAAAALPISAEAWAGVAEQEHRLWRQKGDLDPKSKKRLQSALHAAQRAIALNRRKAEYYRLAGRIRADQGELPLAVPLFRQSAELHPSVPRTWLVFAQVAEQLEGLNERVCRAYQRAIQLNTGQYHSRNRLEKKELRNVQEKLERCADTLK